MQQQQTELHLEQQRLQTLQHEIDHEQTMLDSRRSLLAPQLRSARLAELRIRLVNAAHLQRSSEERGLSPASRRIDVLDIRFALMFADFCERWKAGELEMSATPKIVTLPSVMPGDAPTVFTTSDEQQNKLIWMTFMSGPIAPLKLFEIPPLLELGPQPRTSEGLYTTSLPAGRTPQAATLSMLKQARKSICLLCYLLTDDKVIDALVAAAQYQEPGSVIVPRRLGSRRLLGSVDVKVVLHDDDKNQRACDRLKEHAFVRLSRGRTHHHYGSMHCKTLLVDGVQYATGSYNPTWNATTNNHEHLTVMHITNSANEQQHFADVWASATPVL